MWSPLMKRHLSDLILWSVFQSSFLHITSYISYGPSVWLASIYSSLDTCHNPQNQGFTNATHAWYKALQHGPIKGAYPISMLGS